jgi:protein-tyrosine-phosphatase
VCDNAAGEACPVWPRHPMTAHWGLPDPAAVEGTDLDRASAFRETYRVLERRVGLFSALPLDSLDRLSLLKQVREIGRA